MLNKLVGLFLACGLLGRAADSGAVEYGKLVEEVAKCGNCHTPPQNDRGV
jgi:hypothetical protein